jgi:hypothetical protein
MHDTKNEHDKNKQHENRQEQGKPIENQHPNNPPRRQDEKLHDGKHKPEPVKR